MRGAQSAAVSVLIFGALCCGCSSWSHQNVRHSGGHELNPKLRASFSLSEPRGEEEVLVILALSGGGSRAACFSSEVMFRLQSVLRTYEIDLLGEVDVISSVSGGGLAAAYYCSSLDPEASDDPRQPAPGSGAGAEDPEDASVDSSHGGFATATGEDARLVLAGRIWEIGQVRDLMSRNYLARWFGNSLWPHNFVRYWFTAYDRSNVMAQSLADNLYDGRWGRDLTLGELNPERPYLILNATNATETADDLWTNRFGDIVTFTREDFRERLDSEIASYPIAQAVMASATFPGLFNYTTIADYRELEGIHGPRYLHLFDGGNSDNLGLRSAERIIFEQRELTRPDGRPQYSDYVVIVVDSYASETQGVDRNDPDVRTPIIDFNFIESFNSILQSRRQNVLKRFKSKRLLDPRDQTEKEVENLTFWHIQVEDIPDQSVRFGDDQDRLITQLRRIPTSLSISNDNRDCLIEAARQIIDLKNRSDFDGDGITPADTLYDICSVVLKARTRRVLQALNATPTGAGFGKG